MGKYSRDELGGLGAYQVGKIHQSFGKTLTGTIVECGQNKNKN